MRIKCPWTFELMWFVLFSNWFYYILQFEDFANHNAFDLLAKYSKTHLVFNDDIQVKFLLTFCSIYIYSFFDKCCFILDFLPLLQGTASVVLAGLVASLKLIGGNLADHKFLFLGAGEVTSHSQHGTRIIIVLKNIVKLKRCITCFSIFS